MTWIHCLSDDKAKSMLDSVAKCALKFIVFVTCVYIVQIFTAVWTLLLGTMMSFVHSCRMINSGNVCFAKFIIVHEKCRPLQVIMYSVHNQLSIMMTVRCK